MKKIVLTLYSLLLNCFRFVNKERCLELPMKFLSIEEILYNNCYLQ